MSLTSASDNELLNLKNLGTASVNILKAVGVNNPAELADTGAVETYCRIRSRGIHVSKVMLYALQGALMNVHWNELSPDLKAQLVEEANQLETSSQI